MSNTAQRIESEQGKPQRVVPYVPTSDAEEAATRAERYNTLLRELDALRDVAPVVHNPGHGPKSPVHALIRTVTSLQIYTILHMNTDSRRSMTSRMTPIVQPATCSATVANTMKIILRTHPKETT